jgi:hypothetical protein
MSASATYLTTWLVRVSGAGRGRRTLYTAAIQHGTFAVAPVVGTLFLMYLFRSHWFALDFRLSYWPAASRALRGMSPYVDPGAFSVPRDAGFAYPAVGALALAPFALLAPGVGGAIFTALNIAAVPFALRLLGVRDWRLYGAVFLWLPVISAWNTANVTLLLLLGIAALWRWRHRPVIAGVLTAAMISVKPVVWPLGLWLLVTRRNVSLAYGVAVGLILNVAAWGILGFDQIHRYRLLVQAVGRQGERIAYTMVALALHFGAHGVAAYALGLAPGVAICLVWLLFGRHADDRTAMVICIAVMTFLTSIVWLQYFALLIVPLALMRPRLSPAWGLPMLMDLCLPVNHPAVWQQALALATASAVICVALRRPDPVRVARPHLSVRAAA